MLAGHKNLELIHIKIAYNAMGLAFFWKLNIDREKNERISLQGKSTYVGLEYVEKSTEDDNAYLSFETFREDFPEKAQ